MFQPGCCVVIVSFGLNFLELLCSCLDLSTSLPNRDVQRPVAWGHVFFAFSLLIMDLLQREGATNKDFW